jgi:hypothetical protein
VVGACTTDYRFLEEVGSTAEATKRVKPCDTRASEASARTDLELLRREAAARGVELLFQPQGMERRRMNTSWYCKRCAPHGAPMGRPTFRVCGRGTKVATEVATSTLVRCRSSPTHAYATVSALPAAVCGRIGATLNRPSGSSPACGPLTRRGCCS